MAIAAILFSLWYADISKALEILPNRHREDNVGSLQTVKGVLYAKAIPVAIMAGLVTIIFIPDAINLFIETWNINQRANWKKILSDYDAVRTAYFYVTLLSLALAVYMFNLVAKLIKLKKTLS